MVIVVCFCEYKLKKLPYVNTYAAKEYMFKKQKDSTEILFLGSSQLLDAIYADSIHAKIYNFSNVSQTIHYNIALGQKSILQLPKLKTVVIGISYFSFFYQLEDIPEAWRNHYYKIYHQINPYSKVNFNIEDYAAVALCKPREIVKLAIHNFKNKDACSLTSYGSLFKTTHESITDSIALQRVLFLNKLKFIGREKQIKDQLAAFVALLHQRKINIVFTSTPVHPSFYKYCDKKIIKANNLFINQLNNKYGSTYFNLFYNPLFIEEDFANCDHLHFNGAKKFSGLLQKHLQVTSKQ